MLRTSFWSDDGAALGPRRAAWCVSVSGLVRPAPAEAAMVGVSRRGAGGPGSRGRRGRGGGAAKKAEVRLTVMKMYQGSGGHDEDRCESL